MKYIFTTIFALTFVFGLSAQDIRFKFTTMANGDNTNTVTFQIENTGAVPENFGSFAINFYYDQAETQILSTADVDFTPVSAGTWNWAVANEIITLHQANNNPSVPSSHTGYFVYQNLDNSFAGVMIDPGETVTLGTVLFDNSPGTSNDGGEGFMATIVEQLNHEYAGLDDFAGHDVLEIGAKQQILPITLRSFTATKNDRSVNLDWTTSSESNGSHFEIERSQDLEVWTALGTVAAVGESTILQDYAFLDDKLPLNARSYHKTFYYRLKMVDLDEQSEYSEIRSVRFDLDGEGDLLVYPNPAINEVYVNLSSVTPESGPATMNIVNANGQLVKRVVLSTSDDIRVDVSDMTPGVYYFLVDQEGQSFSQKVIKVD